MTMPIRRIAVLGAGVMGAQIAAHLANAGVEVLLLDINDDAAVAGLKRARTLKPDPFFLPSGSTMIQTGSLEHLEPLAAVDWVIEAVVEDLDIKRSLLERVDAVRAPHTVVSSNTSGIPLSTLSTGRSESFRRHWLGTHFFNPPRHLHLVEVIPTSDTDPEIARRLSAWIDHRLGKGVVVARDTPAFIANHLGMFGVLRLLDAVADGRYSIEEVDAITGPVLGRPKSATFRTVDIAGLDILAKVCNDLAARLPRSEDRRLFIPPQFVSAMMERGLLGDKTGHGFYEKVRGASGSEILTLDLDTFTYRPRKEPALPELAEARTEADLGARVAGLFAGAHRTGQLLRESLGPTLLYAARVAEDIAFSIDDVDRAMRWGFGWELGPFELLDAIGVATVEATAGPGAESTLGGRTHYRDAPLPPAAADLLILKSARDRTGTLQSNDGASLVDLGDGVLCVEFHSKMNAIGGDTIAMLHAGVREAETHFEALVVGNEGQHFSAGANLLLLLLEAQEGNWDDVDRMVRGFQGATMALKTAGVPVVIAPFGLALGGGCEVALHGTRVQAAAETYMGLVEVGVGLIPAGGGSKEMLIRAASAQSAFETIGFAKVSTSGPDAQRLGYLRDGDAITMNRERLINDAKTVALGLSRTGYRPAVPAAAIPVGGPTTYAALSLGVHLARRAGRITDHDALIGRKLAWILSGGGVPHATTLTEAQMLDLEREAFLSLCGEPLTQARIAHTLKTGQTLRN